MEGLCGWLFLMIFMLLYFFWVVYSGLGIGILCIISLCFLVLWFFFSMWRVVW